MPRYVALLRGINVGGRNRIPMAELRACVEAGGFDDVVTYIQSGNVLFRSQDTGAAALAARLERLLADAFDYEASVVLRTHAQMRAVVRGAPQGFGADPSGFRSDVIFLKAPLTAATALRDLPTKPGVDEAHGRRGVLYVSRVASRATQSRVGQVAALPMYRNMTIRNWRTTTTLLEMLDGAG